MKSLHNYIPGLSPPKKIELSKDAITPNIIFQKYPELLISCNTIRLFWDVKQDLFTSFISTNDKHTTYKADNNTSITKFIENSHDPTIPTPYSQSSTKTQISVIMGIQYFPI